MRGRNRSVRRPLEAPKARRDLRARCRNRSISNLSRRSTRGIVSSHGPSDAVRAARPSASSCVARRLRPVRGIASGWSTAETISREWKRGPFHRKLSASNRFGANGGCPSAASVSVGYSMARLAPASVVRTRSQGGDARFHLRAQADDGVHIDCCPVQDRFDHADLIDVRGRAQSASDDALARFPWSDRPQDVRGDDCPALFTGVGKVLPVSP